MTMNPINTQGKEIKNLITKFYYDQNNYLCYQIILHFADGGKVPYKVFTDYKEYKKEFNKLVVIKENKHSLELPLQKTMVSHHI